MLTTFLLVVPLLGLLLLGAQRLLTDPADWRVQTAWAALIAVPVIAGVEMIDGLRELSGGESQTPLVVIFAALALLLAATVVAVRAIRSLHRDGPSEVQLTGPGWLLLLAPLIYFSGGLLITVLPIALIGIGVFRLLRLRDGRLLTLLAVAAESGEPLHTAIRQYAGPSRAGSAAAALKGPLAVDDSETPPKPPKPRSRLHHLADLLESGRSLSDAATLSKAIAPRVIDTIRAAEQSGRLRQTLVTLADEERRRTARVSFRETAGLLAYLWVIVGIGGSILGFIGYYIAPKLKHIFDEFGLEGGGRFAGVADGMSATTLSLGALFAGAIAASMVALRGIDWSPGWQRILPRTWAGGRMLRSLAEPYLQGRPVEPVVVAMQAAATGPFWQDLWADLESHLDAGTPLPEAMHRLRLVTAAERRAMQSVVAPSSLGPVLRELANQRDRRIQTRAYAVGFVLRSLIVIVIGVATMAFGLGVLGSLSELISALS